MGEFTQRLLAGIHRQRPTCENDIDIRDADESEDLPQIGRRLVKRFIRCAE
jgi:hypothetical protein